LCPNHRCGSPQVEIEIIGIPVDCMKHKSKVMSRNQLNPIWNELYTFQVNFQDLAFVRCTVTETTSGHVTGQRIIPLRSLRPGR
jgi:phosphatidylinositol phospholipase C epsilon